VSFLLDTDVLSEVRKRKPDAGVAEWFMMTPPTEVHLSVLSVGEILSGTTRLRDRGDARQALVIERWLAEVVEALQERILSVTIDVAEVWSGLSQRRAAPAVDSLIVATAIARNLTMVTRNTRHFGLTGVRMVNPFAG
jgi:toxin FitB